MALSDELEALAKRHGATSYRNRADTQHPAYGFTEGGLNGLIGEVLAKWGAQDVPASQGYALVPVEPTPEMVDAAQEAYMPFGDMQLAIQLAIAASPQPVVVREPLTDSQAQAGACEWKHDDDDGFWDTECGQPWRFDDGGPKENHMNFCPCCGKPLRIKGGQHGTE